MSTLTQVVVSFDPQLAIVIHAALNDYGIASFIEGKLGTSDTEDVAVTFFSDSEVDGKRLETFLHERIKLSGLSGQMEVQTEAATQFDGWESKWKEQWQPTSVADGIIVCPTFIDYEPAPDEQVIWLDTTNAFGTGSHETTKLCARLMREEFEQRKISSVLDVGCGTGVLAIIAAKLGAERVVGIDIMYEAIESSRSNARINGVGKIQFSSSVLSDVSGTFDLVVANILSSTLREMYDELVTRVERGGSLLLSGILFEELEEFRKQLRITETQSVHEGEWAALKIKK